MVNVRSSVNACNVRSQAGLQTLEELIPDEKGGDNLLSRLPHELRLHAGAGLFCFLEGT